MSIKISELPQAANVGNNDFVPIVQNGETKKALASDFGGGGGGTSDYTDLTNKPSINSVTLTGDKTSGDLNIVGTGDIATTIDSTSTNDQVAGAKAVYDYINKPRATYVLNDNFTITPVSSFTPIDLKMAQDYNNDTSTFSYNTSTGAITILKTGRYQFKLTTQIRASSEATSSCFVSKGYGFRWYRGSTVLEMYTVAQQTYLTHFAQLWGEIAFDMQQGDIIMPAGYTRILSGSAGGVTSTLWGAKRTLLDIQLLEETTATAQTLNASLMNTGSLVGMGDRAELLGTAETEVETKESGDTL